VKLLGAAPDCGPSWQCVGIMSCLRVREPQTESFKSGASAVPTGYRWSWPPADGRPGRGAGARPRIEHTDVLIRRRLYPQTMHRRPPFVMGL
jgi:hypothetical protein